MGYRRPGDPEPTNGKGKKLTPKMEKFVEHYMVTDNATESVKLAGYATRHAHKMGAQLLAHPLVKEEIKKRHDARRERMELTADYVLTKLQSIVEKTEEGNPQAALRGLELLGRHLGLYKDRQEISGPDGGAIELERKKIEEDVSDFTSRIARLAKRNGTSEVVEFPK